jgi:hypothetical protein
MMNPYHTFSAAARPLLIAVCLLCVNLPAQSFRIPWSGYGHSAQHDGLSPVPSQPLNRILWQTPADLSPPTGGELNIHYGSPLITRSNTVIVSTKIDASGSFVVKSLVGTTGATNWVRATDYILPPHDWVPSFGSALTPRNRLCFPGAGGTVYYCDSPDSPGTPAIGQLAFFGIASYNANMAAYQAKVFIDTPITSDRYGNIFFGFQATGSTPTNLRSGLARIDFNGTGAWLSASNAAQNVGIGKVTQNCAPALSNDHKTLYVTVNSTNYYAYLLALDSRTLAVLNRVRLKDAQFPANDVNLGDNGSSSATVGPDGDVYFGVQENPLQSNNNRGWLLHFNSTLTQLKLPGAFGWDATASVVPASMVSSYHGTSSYLLITKYNNYADSGGDGVNKLAVLDPNASMTDPVTGINVMKEILTIAGPTADPDYRPWWPNAVREWCINSAVVDPFTKAVLANNEDGNLYRWDLTSNTLSEAVSLTAGQDEAYTPTVIGVDGTVYAINGGIIFAVGR